MRWVVDDGPLGLLARHFNAAWQWRADVFEIMESVAAGAQNDRSGRRQDLLALKDRGGFAIRVRSLALGSAAGNLLLDYLRPDATSATRDLGEDESIAYCIEEARDATFVTMDKRAAYVALSELGPGRVAAPFDLWHWLRTEGLIAPAECSVLCEATVRQDSGLPGIPRRWP